MDFMFVSNSGHIVRPINVPATHQCSSYKSVLIIRPFISSWAVNWSGYMKLITHFYHEHWDAKFWQIT